MATFHSALIEAATLAVDCPVFAAVEAVRPLDVDPGLLVLLTPAAERLTQNVVRELAGHKRLIVLCGRYEGFDERIRLGLAPREISIGDFVCNGGEVPASAARIQPQIAGLVRAMIVIEHP